VISSHEPHASHQTDVDPRNAVFTRMFADHYAYVWASLRRLGVSTRDTEDLAHDVFVQVYGKLSAYDSLRPLRPWLFGFAFRVASDYRRLARHRIEVMGRDDDVAARGPLAEESLSRKQDAELVAEALNAIDLERRAVLIAFEIDESPMKDVADALQIPLQTAYSRLRVAREEFAVTVRRLRLRRGDL
jgi:RNA polymerase sigma-70 factor, ECF subfamily